MTVISFETIHAQVAAFHAREAANAAPVAATPLGTATAAVYRIRHAMLDMSDGDREHVRMMLREMVDAQDAQTHCMRGHPFDTDNTYWNRGHRCCRTCRREKGRERRSA